MGTAVPMLVERTVPEDNFVLISAVRAAPEESFVLISAVQVVLEGNVVLTPVEQAVPEENVVLIPVERAGPEKRIALMPWENCAKKGLDASDAVALVALACFAPRGHQSYEPDLACPNPLAEGRLASISPYANIYSQRQMLLNAPLTDHSTFESPFSPPV